MDTEVVAAIITACISLILAVTTFFVTRKNQRDLEWKRFKNEQELTSLKAELAERKSEKDAKREYRYEARKRLYEECEPILFQFIELSQNALDRIYALARLCRDGSLKPDSGWLSFDGAPYMITTMYRLIAPMVVFRLFQKRLTAVDLTVDPPINTQYRLGKCLYSTFHEHHELAECEPKIEYDPNSEAAKQLVNKQPAKYYRQGLDHALLDSAVETMIIPDFVGRISYRSYGEFESEYSSKDSGVQRRFSVIANLFKNFHPSTRPVLWRILIAQVYIYQSILRTLQLKDAGISSNITPLKKLSDEERKELYWRAPGKKIDDSVDLIQPFLAAERYLLNKLGDLFEK